MDMKEVVRRVYGQMARDAARPDDPQSAGEHARSIGYSPEALAVAPDGSYLALGCANPVPADALKVGDRVLDLGSGSGFDCFMAAREVGPQGHVIGVDFTPEMVERATENAARAALTNVQFLLGDIEQLPLADASVDVVMSNCTINLTTDKRRAFREAYRVLGPGGRLYVSDMVLLGELPPHVRASVSAYVSCVAGALLLDSYIAAIRDAGFTEIVLERLSRFDQDNGACCPVVETDFSNCTSGCAGPYGHLIASAVVTARRP